MITFVFLLFITMIPIDCKITNFSLFLYGGVILDHQLLWKLHVDYVHGKAMKQIDFLNQNLCACSKPLKELSYKQFVLPILDYASSVWDPYHQGNINKPKMIQHRGACFVLNQTWQRNVRHSVSLLLQSLNWPTLQIRRVCSRLVLLYKIINQIIQIPVHYLPTQSPITTTRTRNDMKFLHYQPSIDCLKYSFFSKNYPRMEQISTVYCQC